MCKKLVIDSIDRISDKCKTVIIYTEVLEKNKHLKIIVFLRRRKHFYFKIVLIK